MLIHLLNATVMTMPEYQRRLVDSVLDELLAALPAVLLVGPRASGKTTTALQRARTVLRLDRNEVGGAVANDPDGVLADSDPPILIDEWQIVPAVLGAVKRSVDTSSTAARFILTGSSRADLQADGWPATGRVVRVPVWPMNMRERVGRVGLRSLVDRMFDNDFAELVVREPPNLRDYIEIALQSGFPEITTQPNSRVVKRWLESYVDQVILRDAPFAGQDRDPQRLRAYLTAIAASSAEVVNHKTLYDAAGVSRSAAMAYDSLLELLYVTERVPAYSTNRLSQLNRSPKRYIIEPALIGALLRVDGRTVIRDARLVGGLIDSFVTAQLRSELFASESSPSMTHLRQADGRHEVDLVLEGPAGRIVGIEIKASSAPTAAMIKHLVWLRNELGDQFATGVIFHTGPRPFRMDDRIWALPIHTLWT